MKRKRGALSIAALDGLAEDLRQREEKRRRLGPSVPVDDARCEGCSASKWEYVGEMSDYPGVHPDGSVYLCEGCGQQIMITTPDALDRYRANPVMPAWLGHDKRENRRLLRERGKRIKAIQEAWKR